MDSPRVLAQVEGLGDADPQVESKCQHKDGHQSGAHDVELPAALEWPPRPFPVHIKALSTLPPFHCLCSLKQHIKALSGTLLAAFNIESSACAMTHCKDHVCRSGRNSLVTTCEPEVLNKQRAVQTSRRIPCSSLTTCRTHTESGQASVQIVHAQQI